VAATRKDGFQWQFIGRQIDFKGTVLSAGTGSHAFAFSGMDKGQLDTAWPSQGQCG